MKKWRTVCRLLLIGWLVKEGKGGRNAYGGGLTASWPRRAHSFSRIQRVRIHFSPLPTSCGTAPSAIRKREPPAGEALHNLLHLIAYPTTDKFKHRNPQDSSHD